MGNMNTKKIATGGVVLALSIATLFGATIIPGIELTLYALGSVFVAIIIMEFNVNTGWAFYFASVILSFVLIPNKVALIPYAFFFGIYSIFKYYIEAFKKLPRIAEIILKLVFCNMMIALGFLIFGTLVTGSIHIPEVALPVLLIAAQLFFLAYDYILTLMIGFYQKRGPKA